MTRKPDKHAGVCLGLTLVLLVQAACNRTETATPPVSTVRLCTVSAYAPSEGQRYSATIVPFAQVDLAFKSSGILASLMQVKSADRRIRSVGDGDSVQEGAVLGRVRPDDYRDAVHQIEQEVAKASSAQAKASEDFGRATRLLAKGSVTQPDFEAAKAQLEAANASVKQAEAGLHQATAALQDCTLHAPFHGWVLKRNIEIGGIVGPSITAFTIADTHLVKATFGVPDLFLPRVRLGSRQVLNTDAVGAIEGRITSISASADPRTRVYTIEITIDNKRGALRPGMIAALNLNDGAPNLPVPVIPLSAIVRPPNDPNGFAVYTLQTEQGKTVAHARRVELGNLYGNSIAITHGLEVGDRVVETGATVPRDGEQVEIIH